MKLLILSDIHLEFGPHSIECEDYDVLVLAGDIHTKANAIEWIRCLEPKKPVIYVLGNHEYYGKSYPKYILQLKEETKSSNIFVLENDRLELEGVRFLGCTLWTDYNLFGNPKVSGFLSTSHD